MFLPEFAPSEWKERGVLWNAVEENEKTKDSRLAREFVVALPIELSEAQWKKLLSDFISDAFVADGMCAMWQFIIHTLPVTIPMLISC